MKKNSTRTRTVKPVDEAEIADEDHRLEEELADYNASWEATYDSPELAVSRMSDAECRAVAEDPEADVLVGKIAFPPCFSLEEMDDYADMMWEVSEIDSAESPLKMLTMLFNQYSDRVPVACQCTAAHLKATMWKEHAFDIEGMKEACRDVIRDIARVSYRLGYALRQRTGR